MCFNLWAKLCIKLEKRTNHNHHFSHILRGTI